jgi:hypothetical protein
MTDPKTQWHYYDIVMKTQEAIDAGLLVKMGEQCNDNHSCFDCIIAEFNDDHCDDFYDHAMKLLTSHFPDYG